LREFGGTAMTANLILAALAWIAPDTQEPNEFFASTERFGYSGTITVYNTLQDARSGRNPRHRDLLVPQRDGSIYVVSKRPSFYRDFNAFLTNWYADGANNTTGNGNPNNKNEGFVQMYDDNASNWSNHKGTWSADKQTFTVFAKGRNASYTSVSNPDDYARLWNAGAPAGSGESTKGTFIEYEYRVVAKGLNGKDTDGDGFFENGNDATSYSGYFKGLFQNESATSRASNGFYVVELAVNSTSWAVQRGFARPDRFGSARIER
jgi:hypothetical protein